MSIASIVRSVRKLRALRRRVADADPATNLVSALAGAR